MVIIHHRGHRETQSIDIMAVITYCCFKITKSIFYDQFL